MSTPSKLFATALCCLLTFSAAAQLPPSRERFTEVHRAYAKNPDDVEALLNMALYYFDNSTPMRNLPMAMKYISRAEEQHVYLLENNKIRKLTQLTKKGIDITLLRQTKQNILSAARNVIESRPTLTDVEIDAYLEVFGNDRQMSKILRQMRLQQIYADCLRQATPDAYYSYLTTYPGTVEADQMEELLRQSSSTLFDPCVTEGAVDSIAARYPLSPAVQQAALRRKSRIAFAEAARIGTAGAYNNFLNNYPASDESQQARRILEEYAGLDFSQRSSTMELAHFADSNADSPLADQALAELRRLIYANHDIEAARYYVEHFPLDPFYSEVYSRYYSWFALEGNAGPLRIFENQNPDFPFPRALENDLEQAEDADTILLLGPYREEQYIKYASYVRYLTGRGLAFVPLQRMLQPLLSARQYPAALERVQQFDISFENRWADQYAELQHILTTANPSRTLRAELEGRHISHPVVNAADGRLYFTVSTPQGNIICRTSGKSGASGKTDTVRFSNSDATDLTLFSFYANGQRMLLGSGGDIWIAEQDGDSWRISELPSYPVNTDYIETDAYMVPDGSGMLLASDRPGGHNLQPSGSYFHGDTALATDLYFIPHSPYGWGTPVNLGIGLNTPYCERSPLLSSNLRTLYFISDGYGGLGYGDVMVAERTAADWTSWSTPKNVGREINGPYWERDLSFSPDEKRIYLVSSGASGASGISRISSFATWHDTADSYTTRPLSVRGLESSLLRVSVADLDRQEITQQIDYNNGASTLDLNLRDSTRYILFADAANLFVPALQVGPTSDQPAARALFLRGYTLAELVSVERSLPLYAVDFQPSTAYLLPLGRLQLDQLVRFLEHNPRASVEFSIDVPGTDARVCYDLATSRGNTLRAYLAGHGIEPARVILSPYGNVHAGPLGAAAVSVRFRD